MHWMLGQMIDDRRSHALNATMQIERDYANLAYDREFFKLWLGPD